MSLFKNIVLDHGGQLQGAVAFLLSFSIFGYIMLRAWKMRKDEADHLASLPLENDSDQ